VNPPPIFFRYTILSGLNTLSSISSKSAGLFEHTKVQIAKIAIALVKDALVHGLVTEVQIRCQQTIPDTV
jgi:hypothetical protein